MRRIRSGHSRVDRIASETRVRRGRIGRYVYLALLIALVIWLLDILFGDLLYLEADGMVTQERHTVGLSYPATVRQLIVRKGDRVEAGQRVAEVYSLSIVQDMTDLSSRIAELRARRAEVTSRLNVVNAMLPIARRRAATMEQLRARKENAIEHGLTTDTQLHELVLAEYTIRLEQQRMTTEATSLQTERTQLDQILAHLGQMLESLQDTYRNGTVNAAVEGIIADVAVNPGSVLEHGGALMDILTGPAFVLAYVRPGVLYDVRVGDAVTLQYGVARRSGQVTDVLPLSARLPREFQRTFRPQDRSQVIRIRLDKSPSPPTFTKVEVTWALPLLERITRLFYH